MRTRSPARAGMQGLSLIELMVALAIGLIVIGGVLGLVLSIIRSNNQTIQATRLTQELRAIAAVIASDIKRAGGVIDPMTVATANAGKPLNPFATITSTGTCLRYGYANAAEGKNFHAVSLHNGAVFINTGTTLATATCAGGEQLSSLFVNVDALVFTVTGRRIDVVLQGSLVKDPTIKRTFSQMVFVRSVAGS